MLDNLLQGIKDIFIPDSNFLNDKVSQIRSKFGFVDSVIDTAYAIGNSLTSSTYSNNAPIINMDIDFRGTQKEVTIIDLSWYTPYKPYGDKILGGILWIGFAWSVFSHASNIIGGASGTAKVIGGMETRL